MNKEELKKIYDSTLLCLKYPFLYTRNRFNGRHYNNVKIDNKIYELRTKYLISISVHLCTKDELIKEADELGQRNYFGDYSVELDKRIFYEGRAITVSMDNGYMTLSSYYVGKTTKTKYNIDDYLDRAPISSKDICDFALKKIITKTLGGSYRKQFILYLVVKDGVKIKRNTYGFDSPTFKLISFDIKGKTKLKIKWLDRLNKFLGIFNFIPSDTELDAMEKGWRDKFGEDMCREIRNSILTTYIRKETPRTWLGKLWAYFRGVRHLFKYRIMQIKESWARLCWYAYGDTEDTHEIINKYSGISAHSCIICGKEAKWHTTGWICPYCDEHKPKYCVPFGDIQCP